MHLSVDSSSLTCFLMKLDPCEVTAFLVAYLILLQWIADWDEAFGTLTTKDERDLSFLLAGKVVMG